jgi:DNA-binding NarL/FixJ family response regulator
VFQYLRPSLAITEPEPLTDRETFVLGQLLRGAKVDEIARQIQVKAKTIEKHCETLYQKLGVNTRLHAILMAVHLHLVSLLTPLPTHPATSGKRSYTRRHGR